MNSFENFLGKPVRGIKKKINKTERIWQKSFDYEKGSLNKADLLKSFLNLKLSKSERLEALFNLWREYSPEPSDGAKEKYNFSNFPVNSEKYDWRDKIGEGGENDVYLFEPKDGDSPSWVIKVNYREKDSDARMIKRAKSIKQDYNEIIKSLPENMSHIVPYEQLMIIEDPAFKGNAIVTWQKFLGMNIRDVFEDMDREELVGILSSNRQLFNELRTFQDTMIKTEQETHKVFDIFGPKNLAIAKASEERLFFLDPRFCYKGDGTYLSLEKSEKIKDMFAERMSYLDDVLGEAKKLFDIKDQTMAKQATFTKDKTDRAETQISSYV